MRKLTETQQKALEQIRAKGIWFAYDGISRTTIAALERAGLVTVERTVHTWMNRRSGRHHSQVDWVARPGGASPADNFSLDQGVLGGNPF
jgi:hypothetical protein